jgi:DHA2 family multidrug resistance protein
MSQSSTEAALPIYETITPGVRLLVTMCTMLATLMQALDSTIANVALPYMQGSMSASQDQINWVLTSYIVAAAIMTSPTGFLAGRFGRTRVFVTAVVGFTVVSMLCGLAQSLDQIVLFRLLQGMFGAALVPLSQAVLFDIYPIEKRGGAMALWGMGVTIGPIIGPVLGGWLTDEYSWRWVFFINLPFGAIAAAGLVLFLRETARSKNAKLDWIGFGALSLAIGSFQLMLDRGEELDWFYSREIILEACLAGLGLYVFLVQTALAPKPFLSPKLFKDLNYMIGISFIFIVGLILYATLALLAPYLQVLMNYPVVTAGLVLAPRGTGTMFAMLLCGRLVGRVNVRYLVGFGFFMTAYALYEMTHWTPAISEWEIVSTGFIQGMAVGFVFVPLSTVAFNTLPVTLRTEAAGIFSLMRNLGSAIGISVTGSLLERNTSINHEFIAKDVTPFAHGLQSGAPGLFWNPATAGGAAALDAEISRQASVIAYIDDFKLMMILSILALPFILLLRTKPPAPAPTPLRREVAAE